MRLSDIRKFAYVMPPLPSDPTILVCIYLVLPMIWVKYPDFFCSMLDTIVDNINGYALDPSSSFAIYPPTAGLYKTYEAPKASPGRLKYADAYMNDLLCAAQGDPAQKQRVSYLTISSLKEILPSLPDKMKDSDILKKILSLDGDWGRVKKILVWVIDTHRGTLSLSSKIGLELLSLLEITTNQCHILVKNLLRLIGKLLSMHLVIMGPTRHLYTMQVALTHA